MSAKEQRLLRKVKFESPKGRITFSIDLNELDFCSSDQQSRS